MRRDGERPAWFDPAPGPVGPRLDGALAPAAEPPPDRLRWMVDSIGEVIFKADPEGRWTHLNAAWTRLLGYPVEESLGRVFLDYVHPDDRQGNLDKFIEVVTGPHGSCRFEARYLRADGGVRHMEIHAWIFRGPNGLARALHLETVAEGVESPGQARVLTGLGCHGAQGFLYARPVPLDQFGKTELHGHLSERVTRAGAG